MASNAQANNNDDVDMLGALPAETPPPTTPIPGLRDSQHAPGLDELVKEKAAPKKATTTAPPTAPKGPKATSPLNNVVLAIREQVY